MVHGAAGKLLKRELAEAPYGEPAQCMRARGYASKLHQIVADVSSARDAAMARGEPPPKTLVLAHRFAGYVHGHGHPYAGASRR